MFLENGQTKSFKYDSTTTVQVVEQIKNNMGLVFVIRVDPGELRSDEKNIVVKFLFNL